MKEANFYYFFKNTVRKNYLPDMQESSNAMLTFPEVDKIHTKAPQFICNDFLKMKNQKVLKEAHFYYLSEKISPEKLNSQTFKGIPIFLFFILLFYPEQCTKEQLPNS